MRRAPCHPPFSFSFLVSPPTDARAQILTTLLTRTPSPLANPEWATVPYVRHPPTALDALLDTVALVPGVLADADRLLHHHHHHHGFPPFLDEQKTARDLVARAVALEAELAAWYAGLERAAAANRAMPLLVSNIRCSLLAFFSPARITPVVLPPPFVSGVSV